ncbi:MAG: hypothetical protein P8Z75_08715 [Gammaproteobacteria bacterium]
MKKTIILTWAVFAVLGLTPLAQADVLTMPQSSGSAATPPSKTPATSSTVTESQSQTVPGRGMSMKQVEARFGTPDKKIAAVGNPPISRWIYKNYTVYFEYNLVIDSVLHHP